MIQLNFLSNIFYLCVLLPRKSIGGDGADGASVVIGADGIFDAPGIFGAFGILGAFGKFGISGAVGSSECGTLGNGYGGAGSSECGTFGNGGYGALGIDDDAPFWLDVGWPEITG